MTQNSLQHSSEGGTFLSEREDTLLLQKTRIASGASVPDESEVREIAEIVFERFVNITESSE